MLDKLNILSADSKKVVSSCLFCIFSAYQLPLPEQLVFAFKNSLPLQVLTLDQVSYLLLSFFILKNSY